MRETITLDRPTRRDKPQLLDVRVEGMHACAQTFGVIQRRNALHNHRCDVDDDILTRH